MALPEAAFIEIVERGDAGHPNVIIPNEVRINGIPLLVPEGHSITVHQIDIADHDAVMVTLTLFARRVEMKSEASA